MGFVIGFLNILLVLTSVFLVCLVLIQRGKGGGLAGAFGGPGGSSAFGTKAGDVFTRVTIITAGIWFALAMLSVLLANRGEANSAFRAGTAPAASTTNAADEASAKALEDILSGANKDAPPIQAPAPAPDAAAKPAADGLPDALTPAPVTNAEQPAAEKPAAEK